MSDTPRPNRCETCRCWFDFDDGSDTGECRRHAPVIVAALLRRKVMSAEPPGHAIWPYTHKDDWCGEHQNKGKE
jgi:hypothetical protein